jgi:hypothetical protein
MGNSTARAHANVLTLILMVLAPGGRALAQDLTTTAPTERASQIPLDEYTAFTVPGGGLKIGVLSIEYGLTDRLSIGIDPAPYLVRAFTDYIVPNAHLKGELLRTRFGTVSARAAAYYGWLETERGRDGRILLLPVSVFASGPIVPRLWLHLEANYNWARALVSDDGGKAQVEGVVANTNWQGGAMLEYRVSSLIGLLARGRVQAFTSPLAIRADGMLDRYTAAELAVDYRPTEENPWLAVAAVAFTWEHFGAVVGGGYGQYFIPGGNLAVPYRGFTPEASLWALF